MQFYANWCSRWAPGVSRKGRPPHIIGTILSPRQQHSQLIDYSAAGSRKTWTKKRVKKLFWSSWPLIGGGGSDCAPSDAAAVSLTPGSGSASQGLWRWRRELTQECMERGLIKWCAFVVKNLKHFLGKIIYLKLWFLYNSHSGILWNFCFNKIITQTRWGVLARGCRFNLAASCRITAINSWFTKNVNRSVAIWNKS